MRFLAAGFWIVAGVMHFVIPRYPKVPPAALWARLPLQFVFGWVTWRGTD